MAGLFLFKQLVTNGGNILTAVFNYVIMNV